jgi:D-alanyl-D-alanine carboxypeptidase
MRKRRWKRMILILCALLAVSLIWNFCLLAALAQKRQREERANSEQHKELPAGAFETIPISQLDISRGNLILVNETTACGEEKPSDLMEILSNKSSAKWYCVKDGEVSLRKEAFQALERMMKQFYQETGKGDVMVISGYRTSAYQKRLYEEQLRQEGKSSSDLVQKPGYSEHQTGLAFDFGLYRKAAGKIDTFEGNGVYQWLAEHCAEYGFVVRYPKGKETVTGISYEPWHFRYVGVPHAAIMEEKNMCLEEYEDFLKQHAYGKDPFCWEQDGKKYEIYYVPALSGAVPVPDGKNYSISGNNQDGFIITIEQ